MSASLKMKFVFLLFHWPVIHYGNVFILGSSTKHKENDEGVVF